MPRSRRLCGSPGCRQADFHSGLCDGEAAALQAGPNSRDSPCQPCIDDDDDFQPAAAVRRRVPLPRGSAENDVHIRPSSERKRQAMRGEGSDCDYIPSESDEAEEKESESRHRASSQQRSIMASADAACSSTTASAPSRARQRQYGANIVLTAPDLTYGPSSATKPEDDASLDGRSNQDEETLAQLRDATNHTGSYIAEKAKVHAAFLLHLLGCLWPLTDPAIQSTRIYNPARLAPDACVHFSCRLVVQSARSVAS